MGIRKQYTEEHGEYGKAAEIAVQNWLYRNGYEIVSLPHGNFKWDCLARNEIEEAYVEVERRASWVYGDFPFKTVHVPERRLKSGDAWLFVVRDDLAASLVVFFRYIRASETIEVANKYVASGEHFRNVRYEWCLPLDMFDESGVTIAERNCKRVRELLAVARERGGTAEYCRMLLGPIEPYGMPTAEYHELLRHLADPTLARQRKPVDQSRQLSLPFE